MVFRFFLFTSSTLYNSILPQLLSYAKLMVHKIVEKNRHTIVTNEEIVDNKKYTVP